MPPALPALHSSPPLHAPSLALPPVPDATHARLVSALIHLLFALGFRNIQTPPPHPPASGTPSFHPDVIARSGHNTRSVFAVETALSLRSERATKRLLALATESEGGECWLAVPPETRPVALRHVHEHKIDARVIGV